MLILAALLLSGPEIPATMDPAAMPEYRVLSPLLAMAGQPSAEALGQLKALGFRTVVDLCPEGQGLVGERATVEAQGLRYVWIPIAAEGFRRQDALGVDHIINEPGASPFLLHGSSIESAAAVWAVLQANAGKSQEEALQEGGKAGLKSDEMIAAVRRVLEAPDGTRPPSAAVLDYDQPPRMIKNARPQYPQEAVAKGIDGVVWLELLIDATGRVEQARVIESIPLLDEAAIQCAYLWQFSPAIKDGRPVATRANAPIAFRIFDTQKPKPDKVPTVIEWVNQFKKDAAAMNRDLIVPEAARLGMQGIMEVEFTVKGDGSLSGCRILVSSGSEQLDKSVCSQRFAPLPVETKVMIQRARFHLNESEGGDPKALQGRNSGASGLPLGTGQQMGPLFFDPQGADFTAWLQQFKTEVYQNWIMPQAALMGMKGHVDVEFTVERAGSLSLCRVLTSSGNPSLDKAAKYSLESSHFLALPSDYLPKSVIMRASFFYNDGPATTLGASSASVAADGPTLVGGREVERPTRVHYTPPDQRRAEAILTKGYMLLEVIIDTQGRPTGVNVLRGMPGGLDMVAAEAIKTWRYEPVVVDGVPRQVRLLEGVEFLMNEREVADNYAYWAQNQRSQVDERLYAIWRLQQLLPKSKKLAVKTFQQLEKDKDALVARAATSALVAVQAAR